MGCLRPWVRRLVYTITLALIGYIAWASMDDPEAFWAPGHLSRHHTDIEQCAQCHQPFEGPTFHKCVSCHSLKQFASNSRPMVSHLHRSIIEKKQTCMACHVEHQGLLKPITAGIMENPHGEFIFRVSKATSCSSCHAVEIRDNATNLTLLQNAEVQNLIREGEDAHRLGHFAHCLNCHIGGQVDWKDESD